MAIKFWRLSQSLLIEQPGEVAKHRNKRKRGGQGMSHDSPRLQLSGNITSWKSYLSLSSFNFFLHPSALSQPFSLHFAVPVQQLVSGVPSCFLSHVFTHLSLQPGRGYRREEQEPNVTDSKQHPLTSARAAGTAESGQLNHLLSGNQVSLTFARSSKSPCSCQAKRSKPPPKSLFQRISIIQVRTISLKQKSRF